MDMSEAVKHSSHIDPYPPEGNTVVKKAVWDELFGADGGISEYGGI